MPEAQYTLKAYREDSIGYIHEQEVSYEEDHLEAAKSIAERFGLGAFVKANHKGQYIFEDGDIVTHFRLTPRN